MVGDLSLDDLKMVCSIDCRLFLGCRENYRPLRGDHLRFFSEKEGVVLEGVVVEAFPPGQSYTSGLAVRVLGRDSLLVVDVNDLADTDEKVLEFLGRI